MDVQLASFVTVAAAAAACLLALLLERWRIGATVALFCVFALGGLAALTLGTPAEPEAPILLADVVLAGLCFRLGREGRDGWGPVPLPLLVASCAGLTLVGSFLVGSTLRYLDTLGGASDASLSVEAYLLLAVILLLPDASRASSPRRDERFGSPFHGLRQLLGATAVPLLVAAGVLLGTAPEAAPDPPAPQGLLPLVRSTGVALGAFAIGWIAGLVARYGTSIALPRVTRGLRVAAALGSYAAGDILHEGLGAVAALAAGLAAGPLPRRSSPERDEDGGWLVFGGSAMVLVSWGLREASDTLAAARNGALLWASLVLVRVLVFSAIAGAYRWARPSQLSWSWILATVWLAHPGTLGLALALALGAASHRIVTPDVVAALAIALLVEGGTAPLIARYRLWAGGSFLIERARGRRIAVRAAREALQVLERRGELDELTRPERDELFRTIDDEDRLVELELEDLAQQYPGPHRTARVAVVHEVQRRAFSAVDDAVGAGVLSRRVSEAIRADVARWLGSALEEDRDGPRPPRAESRRAP